MIGMIADPTLVGGTSYPFFNTCCDLLIFLRHKISFTHCFPFHTRPSSVCHLGSMLRIKMLTPIELKGKQ